MSDPRVTVCMLIYRSPAWLDFALKGLENCRSEHTDFAIRVIANDPEPQIESDPRVTDIFRNSDPSEYYLKRVYRAWNYAVETSPTELVILMNSDMVGSDHWIDQLVAVHDLNPSLVPTSLLVESGRITSGIPEYVKDFGQHPSTFQWDAWYTHAGQIRMSDKIMTPGRLYMPVLLTKTQFREVGGYPIGNVGGRSGDALFFEYLDAAGYTHVTAPGSVVYHAQQGEFDNP